MNENNDLLLKWYRDNSHLLFPDTGHIPVKTQQAMLNFKLNLNTVQNSVRNQKFIIGTINKSTRAFSVSENPVVHVTATDADTEAKRLAGLDSTKIFIVLKLTNGFQNVIVQNVETLH